MNGSGLALAACVLYNKMMKIRLAIVLILTLTRIVLFSLPDSVLGAHLPCRDNEREILAKFGAPNSKGSFRHDDQLFVRKVMAGAEDPSPLLLRRTRSTMTSYRFSDDCSFVASHEFNIRPVLDQFELDEILDKSAKKKIGTVIYIWSARMPLSVSGLEGARAAAKKVGAFFVAAVDDATSDRERVHQFERRFVQKVDLLPFRPDLMTSESSSSLTVAHFPTVFFVKDGKIFGSGFPGYKTTKDYADIFRIVLGPSHD
tara:strand:+ start:47171 stop:47944 length:774 start_codon:yes stop_codon:yes gene_type:complete